MTRWNYEPSQGNDWRIAGRRNLVGETMLGLEAGRSHLERPGYHVLGPMRPWAKYPSSTLVPPTLIVSNKESIREPYRDLIRTW